MKRPEEGGGGLKHWFEVGGRKGNESESEMAVSSEIHTHIHNSLLLCPSIYPFFYIFRSLKAALTAQVMQCFKELPQPDVLLSLNVLKKTAEFLTFRNQAEKSESAVSYFSLVTIWIDLCPCCVVLCSVWTLAAGCGETRRTGARVPWPYPESDGGQLPRRLLF